MSKKSMIVLIYYRHTLWDLIRPFCLTTCYNFVNTLAFLIQETAHEYLILNWIQKNSHVSFVP
jgi:hypothetical protein